MKHKTFHKINDNGCRFGNNNNNKKKLIFNYDHNEKKQQAETKKKTKENQIINIWLGFCSFVETIESIIIIENTT